MVAHGTTSYITPCAVSRQRGPEGGTHPAVSLSRRRKKALLHAGLGTVGTSFLPHNAVLVGSLLLFDSGSGSSSNVQLPSTSTDAALGFCHLHLIPSHLIFHPPKKDSVPALNSLLVILFAHRISRVTLIQYWTKKNPSPPSLGTRFDLTA